MFPVLYTLQIVDLVPMGLVADLNVIVQMIDHVRLTREFVMVDSVIQTGMGSTVKVIQN